MFGTHVGVIQRLGLRNRQLQNLLGSRRERNIAHHLGLRALPNGLLHFNTDLLQGNTHPLKHGYRYAFRQSNQTQEEMFRPHIGMVETIGLFLGKVNDLLCSRCETVETIHRYCLAIETPFSRSRIRSARYSSRSAAESSRPATF